eukprot:1904295-Rhodomonas_salina.2
MQTEDFMDVEERKKKRSHSEEIDAPHWPYYASKYKGQFDKIGNIFTESTFQFDPRNAMIPVSNKLQNCNLKDIHKVFNSFIGIADYYDFAREFIYLGKECEIVQIKNMGFIANQKTSEELQNYFTVNLLDSISPMHGPIVFYHHTGNTNKTNVFNLAFNFLLMAIYRQGNISLRKYSNETEEKKEEETTFYLIVSDFEKNASYYNAMDMIFSLTEKYTCEFGTFIKCYPIQTMVTEHLNTRVLK